MTKLRSLSIGALLFLMIFQNPLISCTKTTTASLTVTSSILTANSWKYSVVKAEVGGNYESYTRGGSGNTLAIDNAYLIFKSDGTGTLTNLGVTSTFTWNFTDATNSSIIWNWNNAVPATVVTWQNLIYRNGGISYTEFYTYSGQNELASETLIPK